MASQCWRTQVRCSGAARRVPRCYPCLLRSLTPRLIRPCSLRSVEEQIARQQHTPFTPGSNVAFANYTTYAWVYQW